MANEKRSNKWAFLLYQESAPENYLAILEDMHIPLSSVLGMIKMLIKRLANSKRLTNMVLSTLILLKATPKFRN